MDTEDSTPQPQRKSLRPGLGATDGPEQWATEVLPAVPGDDGVPGNDGVPFHADAFAEFPNKAPWYRTPWVWALAGGGLLAVAVGVTWALLASGGEGEVIASPSESPSPSASTSPSAEPASLLDDAIAADEYPDAAARAGDRYPEALVMEDWVWDKVGPGWALVSLAPYDATTLTYEPMVVYLASPEGVLFDLQHAPPNLVGAKVVSFLEDERKARIVAYDNSTDASGGGLLTLTSGAFDAMSFSFASGTSASESLKTASSSNAELWLSQPPDWSAGRFERWTPAAGWHRPSLESDVVSWSAVVSPNGELVVFEIASNTMSGFSSARSGADGSPNLIVYAVDTDSANLVRPAYQEADGFCTTAAVTDGGVVIVGCWGADWQTRTYYTATHGAPLTPAGDELPLAIRLAQSVTATDVGTGLTFLSTTGDGVAFEVSVTVDGEQVTVLASGEELGYQGIANPSVVDLGGGLAVITGDRACAVVDIENGQASVLGELAGDGAFGCVAYGVGGGRVSADWWYGGE